MASGAGARALAMGSSFTAVAGDVTAVYWNPAALAAVEGLQLHVMHSERFAGTVNSDFIAASSMVPGRSRHVFALSYFRLGVDGIPLTRLQNPDLPLGTIYTDTEGKTVINDPYVYKKIDNVDNCLVMSYAAYISDHIAVGGSAKIIRKTAEITGAWGIGFDAGLLYTAGSSFSAGLLLKDATTTSIAWTGSVRESVLPTVTAGLAYHFRTGLFAVLTTADGSMNIENRDAVSQISWGRAGFTFRGGCEVTYDGKVSFRAGINHDHLTAGAGFSFSNVTIDYGFSPHSALGNTHRLSAVIRLRSN